MPRLIIDGERVKRRYLVMARGWEEPCFWSNSNHFLLQGRAFKALIQLAYANIVDEFLFTDPQGIKYEAISRGNASQVIHQLKGQCPPLAGIRFVFATLTNRRYILPIKTKDIKFNFSRLKEYPDVEVREMIEDIQRKTGDVHERRNG